MNSSDLCIGIGLGILSSMIASILFESLRGAFANFSSNLWIRLSLKKKEKEVFRIWNHTPTNSIYDVTHVGSHRREGSLDGAETIGLSTEDIGEMAEGFYVQGYVTQEANRWTLTPKGMKAKRLFLRKSDFPKP